MNYFHLVFQITQECPFECAICLRYYSASQRALQLDQWKIVVANLKKKGLKRLTITGGEPMILGNRLQDFIKFLHDQEIHASLATTGFGLTEATLHDLDRYLDHILISIRSLSIQDWKDDFGDSNHTFTTFQTVQALMTWVKKTGILLEVNTVVHRENIHLIYELGAALLKMNQDIIWRVEDYYANGLGAHLRSRYEVADEEFDDLCGHIKHDFDGRFRGIRFVRSRVKARSPGYLVAQNGDLLLTSDYQHSATGFNALNNLLPDEFGMIRPWGEYKSISRDWGWGDFDESSARRGLVSAAG